MSKKEKTEKEKELERFKKELLKPFKPTMVTASHLAVNQGERI